MKWFARLFFNYRKFLNFDIILSLLRLDLLPELPSVTNKALNQVNYGDEGVLFGDDGKVA